MQGVLDKKFLIIALAAGLLGYAFSFLLLEHHYESKPGVISQHLCGTSPDSGCNLVNRSNLSSIAGIPVALLGMVYYSIALVLILSLFKKETEEFIRLLFSLSIIGLVIDFSLLILSVAVLNTLCKLCAVTYLATAFLLWSSLMLHREKSMNVSFSFLQQISKMPVMSWVILLLLTAGHGFTDYFNYSLQAQTNQQDALIEQSLEEEYVKYKATPAAKIQRNGLTPKGSENPVIIIDEYADPMCPGCQDMYGRLKVFMQAHGAKVQLYYHPYPLDNTCNKSMSRQLHAGACELSQAKLCAGKQGKFWEVHDEIFEKASMFKNGVSMATLSMLKSVKSLNQAQFSQCYNGKKTQLISDIKKANKLGVNSTPTFFVNGKKMGSFRPWYLELLLLKIIEKES
jgi:protein-disulfide isomerase/uncharacterized membrane protein